jgi:hypothetical protein
MYILIKDSKYGKSGRTITPTEFNRIPLIDQKLFERINFMDKPRLKSS